MVVIVIIIMISIIIIRFIMISIIIMRICLLSPEIKAGLKFRLQLLYSQRR